MNPRIALTLSITAALAAGCDQISDEQGEKRIVDFDVIETENTLTIAGEDASGAELGRFEMVVGPMTLSNGDRVMFGRKLTFTGIHPDLEATYEGESTLRLDPPNEHRRFFGDARLTQLFADWGLTFDWTSAEAKGKRLAEQEAVDVLGEWHVNGTWLSPPYFGPGCGDFVYSTEPAASRFWPGGDDGGQWTACRAHFDVDEPGTGVMYREMCFPGIRRWGAQRCVQACTAWDGGWTAQPCNTVADCPTNCNARCSGEHGQLIQGQSRCQADTYYGLTAFRGCTGEPGANLYGPFDYCSMTDWQNNLHYSSCGDGRCAPEEWCDTCPQDCGSCNYCGDGNCDGGEEGWCCGDCYWTCYP